MRRVFKKTIALTTAMMAATFTIGMAGVTVLAEDYEDNSQLYFVTDAADILSDEEESSLETYAAEISQQYGCGVYILTVDDYHNYTNSDIMGLADETYEEYTLGLGEGRDAEMLILSMEDRDFLLYAHGPFANEAFTDYGKDMLEDYFLDDFKNDNWYDGFHDYIEKSGEYLDSARQGNPIDDSSYIADSHTVGVEDGLSLESILIRFLAIPIVGAIIVAIILAAKMKSVKVADSAQAYMTPGSATITHRSDLFTHRTETRRKIEKSSSGGGGTHVTSSGGSGRSGKF